MGGGLRHYSARLGPNPGALEHTRLRKDYGRVNFRSSPALHAAVMAKPRTNTPKSIAQPPTDDTETAINAPLDTPSPTTAVDPSPSPAAIIPDDAPPPTPDFVAMTLGDVAYQLLDNHWQVLKQQRSSVLQGVDPEDIHQLRITLRQIRTTLQTLGTVIKLPKAAQEAAIRDLAKPLGTVRDLDVLQDRLTQDYHPNLPANEQLYVEKVLSKWRKKREVRFQRTKKLLDGNVYRKLRLASEDWLRSPCYTLQAQVPLTLALPDLLLSLFCQLFQHPGWLVGATWQDQTQSYGTIDLAQLSIDQLHQDSTYGHDLRKTVKKVRYQSTLLAPFTTQPTQELLQPLIQDLKEAQVHLGNLQDLSVLRSLLQRFLARKGHSPNTLKDCFAQIDQRELDYWNAWQPLQAKYLKPSFRAELRQTLLTLY